MNKPRFLHDPKSWPHDTYLGTFERFDIYFEDHPTYQKGSDFLLICRFGNLRDEYYSGSLAQIRTTGVAWSGNLNVEMDIALRAALKMYDDYVCDPSVSPNARAPEL